MMNRRDMKKLVQKRMASFLVNYLNTPWRDVPDFFHEVRLYAFRDSDKGTQAERDRLRSVMFEIHREVHQYEVKKER